MSDDQQEQAGVRQVAAMIKAQHGGTIPVTELLHRCGRYHPAALPDIIRALQDQRIAVDPDSATQRWHTLRLTPMDDQPNAAPDAGESLKAWLLSPGGFKEIDFEQLPADGLRWIDLPHHRVTDELPGLLRHLLDADSGPSLTPDNLKKIVDDLARPDHRPNRHVFGDSTEVRTLAAFAVEAVERKIEDVDSGDPRADKAGVLELRLVEMVVGRSWMVTVRFPSERVNARRVSGRTDASHNPEVLDVDNMVTALERRWRRSCVSNTLEIGDLGILLFHQVIDSYRDALRLIDSWLTQWELQAIDPDLRTERDTLSSLRLLLEEFESRVEALSHPHRHDPVTGWFPRVRDEAEAAHVLMVINGTLRELDRLQQRVRTAFDVLEGIESDQGRRRLELFATFIAVPAVMTGFLGMNIWLPLNQRWWSFAIALVIIGVATGFAYHTLAAGPPRASRGSRERRPKQP